MKELLKILFLLFPLILLNCNKAIDGGGGGGDGNAILAIKLSDDCDDSTECVDIYLDNELIKNGLKPGEKIEKEVEVGNHKIYAVGSCDVYREWEEKVIYVPQGGLEEVLNCSSTNRGILTVECSSNCKDIVKKIDLYIDDVYRSGLEPSKEWKGSLQIGNHKIYGTSEKNDEWGPLEVYLPAEGHKEILSCNNSRKAYLTISVSEFCSCNFIYGITIYYTDPVSTEPILAGNINPGQQIIFEATVGYHRITATARCPQDNLTYNYGPEEIYLPVSNYTFTIPCNEFKP